MKANVTIEETDWSKKMNEKTQKAYKLQLVKIGMATTAIGVITIELLWSPRLWMSGIAMGALFYCGVYKMIELTRKIRVEQKFVKETEE